MSLLISIDRLIVWRISLLLSGLGSGLPFEVSQASTRVFRFNAVPEKPAGRFQQVSIPGDRVPFFRRRVRGLPGPKFGRTHAAIDENTW
jgi:hypothetical protein